MTLAELLKSLEHNPKAMAAVSAMITHVPKPSMSHNRTFSAYMRVKPDVMTLTPAYPTNIWARLEYFNPKGRGVAR